MTTSTQPASPADATRAAGKGFRWLSLLTSAWLWLLIVVGGIVRVTGSGLGCPDWPLCYGQVLPPPDQTALIEFSHRLVAGVGGLLILGMVWLAWRQHRDQRWIVWPSLLMIVVLPLQFLLGAVVVLTELEPLSVAVHLGTALIILACCLLATLAANRPASLDDEQFPPHYVPLLLLTVIGLFVLLTTGAVVVGEGASYACPDWPLCQGMAFPAADSPLPVVLQMVHRYTVVITGVLLLAMIGYTLRDRAQRPLASRWAIAVGVLFLAQAAIGAIKIWTHLATIWRVAHLGTAAAVWAALVILAALAYFREKGIA